MKSIDFITGQIYNLIARNFRYNRFYTMMNIGGLAAGLTCAIFILLFLKDELTYDQHHLNKDRIYRLESDFTVSGRSQQVALTSFPFGPVFKEMFPEIESFVRFHNMEAIAVRYNSKQYFETELLYADSSIFEVFSHEFIYGTAEQSLSEVNTIVLTKSMSERYFGDDDPVGSFLELGNGISCMVTAVIADVPGNSHVKFDGLISMVTYANIIGEDVFHDLESRQTWAMRIFTYILLKENSSIESIHEKFPVFYEKHMSELSQLFNGTYNLLSSPLTDIHLYSGLEWDLPTTDIRTIYLFLAIGVFILLIAAINYMNLATARSAGKAREVGIRKVAGATRTHLIRFFISESIVLSLLALILALGTADLLIPWFNKLSGKSLVLLDSVFDPVLFIMIGIALIVGFIAGSYPAFYLSAFKPINVLYGRIFRGRRKGLSRKVLMCFQFFISVSMIIATIVVFQQLKHLKSAELGFDKENLMVFPVMDTTAQKSYPVLREEFLSIPGVEKMSSAMFMIGMGGGMDILMVEDSGGMVKELIGMNYINHHFVDVMGLKITHGRDFDEKNRNDAEKFVLINETAAQKFGWMDDPLHRKIAESANYEHKYEVIGVIRDFHYTPLHQEIGPMIFFLKEEPQPEIHLRLSGQHTGKTIKMIEHAWAEIHPDIPFSYVFLDQELEHIYLKEDKLTKLMGLFTLFSIFIALLGLFSLSSYLTEQYTREISIRKVFGASSWSVVYHLSKQYLFLVIIACILSMPVGWYLMQLWLENFAYRIKIQPWWFILTGLAVVLIAECTVIYQSLKAANRNPSETLRHE